MSLDMIQDEIQGEVYHRSGNGEHLLAAVSYILQCAPRDAPHYEVFQPMIFEMAKDAYPWDKDEFEMVEDTVKSLVRAGAFIAAEIEKRLEAEGWDT